MVGDIKSFSFSLRTRRRPLYRSSFLLLLLTEAKCLLKCSAFLKSEMMSYVSVVKGLGFSFLFTPERLSSKDHASLPPCRRFIPSHLFVQASFLDSLVISFASARVLLYLIFFPILPKSFS